MPIAEREGSNGLARDSMCAAGSPAELWLNVSTPLASILLVPGWPLRFHVEPSINNRACSSTSSGPSSHQARFKGWQQGSAGSAWLSPSPAGWNCSRGLSCARGQLRHGSVLLLTRPWHASVQRALHSWQPACLWFSSGTCSATAAVSFGRCKENIL